jgi:hypothetical protein
MIPTKSDITVQRNCQLAVCFAAHLALLWLEFRSSSLVKVAARPAYERFTSSVPVNIVLKSWPRSSGQYKLSVFANLDGGHWTGTGRLPNVFTNWWLV